MKKLFIKSSILLYSIFLLIGCRSQGEEYILTTEKEFNSIPEPASSLSSIVRSYRFVPLETTPESFLGNIGKTLKYKDRYYITSFLGKTIYIFDNNGSYLRKLDRPGNGPGEYSMITDFDVTDERIIILNGLKMMFYTNDSSMNYLKSVDLNFIPWSIRSLDNSEYCVYVAKDEHVFFVIDENGKILRKGMPADQTTRVQKQFPFIYMNEGFVGVHYGRSNDMFYYDPENKIFSRYKLFPDGYVITAEEENEYILRYSSNFTDQVKTTLCSDPIVTGNRWMVRVNEASGARKYYIADPVRHKIHHMITKETRNDLTYTGLSVLNLMDLCRSENCFVGVIYPGVLLESLEKNRQYASEKAYREITEQFGNGKLREDDNPVLVEIVFN